MWLGFVRVENVNDFGSLCLQVIGDQAAMAFPPDCFCTHDRRRTPSLCRFLQACYSREQLLDGRAPGALGQLVLNGYNAERGGDVVLLVKPYFLPGSGKLPVAARQTKTNAALGR